MKSYKEIRFIDNPKEQEFHDKFKKMFERDGMVINTLPAIIYGWKNNTQTYPKYFLTEKEENICLSLIQWLGSPVGQGFLEDCGFVQKKFITYRIKETGVWWKFWKESTYVMNEPAPRYEGIEFVRIAYIGLVGLSFIITYALMFN